MTLLVIELEKGNLLRLKKQSQSICNQIQFPEFVYPSCSSIPQDALKSHEGSSKAVAFSQKNVKILHNLFL